MRISTGLPAGRQGTRTVESRSTLKLAVAQMNGLQYELLEKVGFRQNKVCFNVEQSYA
jgi:hypothetical protein